MKNKRGFTVIEILLVSAILLIIAALSIPNAFKQIQRAKDIAAHATISNIVSMYRMASTFEKLEDLSREKADSRNVVLPITNTLMASEYEIFISESMNLSFPALIDIKYKLVHNNLSDINDLIVTYWPDSEKSKYYVWENGESFIYEEKAK